MHMASCNGSLDLVSLLIEKGAAINVRSTRGQTPVNWASMGYQSAVVRTLLENGADFTIADDTGTTPLDSASEVGDPQTVRALLDYGAESILANEHGIIPLHRASSGGHLEVVQLLLESSEASLEIRDNCGRTPLFHAAARGHIQTVRLLLSYSALANVTDRYKTTPLCAAARNGHAEEVKLLLPLTDIENHFEDGLGQNLAWWAAKSGCVEIINLVQQWAQKMGFEIGENDFSLGSSPVPPDEYPEYCDVCTRYIMYGGPYYRCETCYYALTCGERAEFGFQCLDASHNCDLYNP